MDDFYFRIRSWHRVLFFSKLNKLNFEFRKYFFYCFIEISIEFKIIRGSNFIQTISGWLVICEINFSEFLFIFDFPIF